MNIPSPPSPRCRTKVHFYRLLAFLCVSKQELFCLKPELFSVQVAAALAQSCHRETDSGLLQSVVLRINSWCVVRLQAEVENKKITHTYNSSAAPAETFFFLFGCCFRWPLRKELAAPPLTVTQVWHGSVSPLGSSARWRSALNPFFLYLFFIIICFWLLHLLD